MVFFSIFAGFVFLWLYSSVYVPHALDAFSDTSPSIFAGFVFLWTRIRASRVRRVLRLRRRPPSRAARRAAQTARTRCPQQLRPPTGPWGTWAAYSPLLSAAPYTSAGSPVPGACGQGARPQIAPPGSAAVPTKHTSSTIKWKKIHCDY